MTRVLGHRAGHLHEYRGYVLDVHPGWLSGTTVVSIWTLGAERATDKPVCMVNSLDDAKSWVDGVILDAARAQAAASGRRMMSWRF